MKPKCQKFVLLLPVKLSIPCTGSTFIRRFKDPIRCVPGRFKGFGRVVFQRPFLVFRGVRLFGVRGGAAVQAATSRFCSEVSPPSDPRGPRLPSSLPQESPGARRGQDRRSRRPGLKLRRELRKLRSAMDPGHGVVLSRSRDGCLRNQRTCHDQSSVKAFRRIFETRSSWWPRSKACPASLSG